MTGIFRNKYGEWTDLGVLLLVVVIMISMLVGGYFVALLLFGTVNSFAYETDLVTGIRCVIVEEMCGGSE